MAELVTKYQQYAEYKDSGVEWLGEIPSHWGIQPLKHLLLLIKNGATTTQVDETDKTVPISRIETISTGEINTSKVGHINPNTISESYKLDKGDILFSHINSLSMIGNLALKRDETTLFHGMNLLRLKVDASKVNEEYFFWLLKSKNLRQVFEANAKPAINQASLSTNSIKNIYLNIPDEDEQTKIANFLDHETAQIDTLIDKQQTLIQLLREKRQAVISHAVTKGLNPDVPMKDSGVEWLGEVPEHWGVSKLKYLISEPLQYGANEAAEDVDKTQPRFVRITDVLPNGNLKDDTFRSLPQEIAEPYMLMDGDVLLARSGGTVGKSFIYRDSWGKCCFAGYLIKAKIDEEITPAEWFYLNTLTDFYWKWIESIQIQATIQNVSADKYNSFVIAVPPLEESYKIISYINYNLEVFDTLVMKAEQAIQLMQERRTALISAAVTGKIDVRGWRAPDVDIF